MNSSKKHDEPMLRFPEFGDQWKAKKIEKIAEVSSGGTPSRSNPNYWGGKIPWITTAEIKGGIIDSAAQSITQEGLDNSSAKIFPSGTVLMAMYGQGQTRGRSAVLGFPAATNQACAAIIPNNGIDSGFVYQNLTGRYDELRDLANDGAQKNLSGGLIKNLPIRLPGHNEQSKIAAFLGSIDKKIGQLRQKKAFLEDFKLGCVQRLYNQEVRFKDEKGDPFPDWEEIPLRNFLTETKAKSLGTEPVFSVSVHKGLIDQIEHLGRSYSASDTGHYNRVEPGDVVYTKSPTGDFPYGIIKQSRLKKGVIVSPLYGVFRPKTPWLGYWLHVYFESHVNTNNYLKPIIQKGAKNTINITNKTFLSSSIKVPTDPEEQRKIAGFLEALDEKIYFATDELDKSEAFKKGLLQKMFV